MDDIYCTHCGILLNMGDIISRECSNCGVELIFEEDEDEEDEDDEYDYDFELNKDD